MENFNLYSKYYDLLYRDKAYKSETEYVLNLIKEHSDIKDPALLEIIELGSGSGGHAKFLSPLISKLVGIERSPEMINQAKQKNIQNFIPLQGDITDFNQLLIDGGIRKSFDAAVSLFHVISYLNTNQQVLNCFKQVNQCLKIGGVFVFDVWFAPAVFWLKPEKRIKKLENNEIVVNRVAASEIDVLANVVKVNFKTTVKDKVSGDTIELNEDHPMRCFSIPEIMQFAELTGFNLEVAEEFLTGNKPSVETWGVCFVLRKVRDIYIN